VDARGSGATSIRQLWPVRSLLICLVLACLVPGLIGAALLVHYDYQASRLALERNSLLTTRALMQAIDSYLYKTQAVAQSLSTSVELRNGNLAGFYSESRTFLAMNGVASAISLSDASAHMLVHTSYAMGDSLPMHGNAEQVRRVFQTGKPMISNLFMGSVTHQLLVSIDVPVRVNGKIRYVLTAELQSDIFRSFLHNQDLPGDWIAGIFDSEGTVVMRTLAPEQFIGKKPSAELLRRAMGANEGTFDSVTPDGIPVLTIFSRSPASGWFVALGIPRKLLEAEYLHPLSLLVSGMMFLFFMGLGLSWWVSGWIASSMRAVSAQARALGMGSPVLMPHVRVKESSEVASALVNAAFLLESRTQALDAERKGREAQLERLVAERTEALQAAIQESERLARCDALTGLQNRRSASERLRAEFQRMQRTGSVYAALLLDVDHFKRINDTFGHEGGDVVLREIAAVFVAGVRVTDLLARFGGEEFLILLPDTDAQGAHTMAEKIRMAVADNRFSVAAQVTISVGIACATPDDRVEDDIVRRADAALYEAKRNGRNQTRQG
jgi:diguanylate cyclase (GGDEF)-like protein